jgi:hypothetical protein
MNHHGVVKIFSRQAGTPVAFKRPGIHRHDQAGKGVMQGVGDCPGCLNVNYDH